MCSGSEAGSYLRLIDFCVSLDSRLESNKEEDLGDVEVLSSRGRAAFEGVCVEHRVGRVVKVQLAGHDPL